MDQKNGNQKKPNKKNSTNSNYIIKNQMQEYLGFSYQETSTNDYYYYKSAPKVKRDYSYRKPYYIRTKFKFIVRKQNIDEQKQFTPEKPLEWEKIDQVIFSTNNDVTCPICMNDTSTKITAPQITNCGHIYCFPCYLRHSVESKNKLRCPICNEFSMKEDLKSAKVSLQPLYQENSVIKLKLMVRNKMNNTIFDPITGLELPEFSRILTVSKSYLNSLYSEELRELDEYIRSCIKNNEKEFLPFAEEAKNIVKFKISSLEAQKNDKKLRRTQSTKEQTSEKSYYKLRKMDPKTLKGEENFFHLYQEEHGQLMYLHPLNYKYLMMEYKTGEEMPSEIESRVQTIFNITLCDKTKKRYKFLSHLPDNTDVKFFNLDLTKYLSYEVNYSFEENMREFCQRVNEIENTKTAIYENKIKKSTKSPEFYPSESPLILKTPPSISSTPGDYPELQGTKEMANDGFSLDGGNLTEWDLNPQSRSLSCKNSSSNKEEEKKPTVNSNLNPENTAFKIYEKGEADKVTLSDYIDKASLDKMNKGPGKKNKKIKSKQKVLLFSNALPVIKN